jgi:hypothetical protein
MRSTRIRTAYGPSSSREGSRGWESPDTPSEAPPKGLRYPIDTVSIGCRIPLSLTWGVRTTTVDRRARQTPCHRPLLRRRGLRASCRAFPYSYGNEAAMVCVRPFGEPTSPEPAAYHTLQQASARHRDPGVQVSIVRSRCTSPDARRASMTCDVAGADLSYGLPGSPTLSAGAAPRSAAPPRPVLACSSIGYVSHRIRPDMLEQPSTPTPGPGRGRWEIQAMVSPARALLWRHPHWWAPWGAPSRRSADSVRRTGIPRTGSHASPITHHQGRLLVGHAPWDKTVQNAAK